MEPEKNLHASVLPALLSRAQKAAQKERISLDKLVSDAMEQRLNRQRFEQVLTFGKRHAKSAWPEARRRGKSNRQCAV